MEIIHQYYYRKWKVVTEAVINTILSVLLVAIAVFSFIHWELNFLFSEWKGYVIMVFYLLITLGIILSAFAAFKKISKVNRGIPAFAVGEGHFVLFDNDGIANTILFEDCDNVRFKRSYRRHRGVRLTLIIKYHNKIDPLNTSRVEINLNELDHPQKEIDKQLKKIYNNYKKQH